MTRRWIPLVLLVALSVPGTSEASYVAESGRVAYVGLFCGSFAGGAYEAWCDETSGSGMSPYIATVNADGSSYSWVSGGEGGSEPTWAPDGAHLAFTRDGDIFVVGVGGGAVVNLTNHPAYDWSPAWSPDGATLAFASDRDGQAELYVMNADGSGATRLTYGVGFTGRPAWSPDGARIAFNCEVQSGNGDICAIDADGTAFMRLTDHPAQDFGPAWSPDGTTLAFATNRYQVELEVALMSADGSGVHRAGAGIVGFEPAWSPDGARIAFTRTGAPECDYVVSCLSTMKPDGTDVKLVLTDGYAFIGYGVAWRPGGVPGVNSTPVASFTASCSGRTCNLDGSNSWDLDGTITSYAWSFGDGTVGSGLSASHTYAAEGVYTVTLSVTDDGGATATQSQSVSTNDPPVAFFTSACSAHTCVLDASVSHDAEGPIVSYAWDFGDGTTGSGASVSHTFGPAAFVWQSATLTVTDTAGATGAITLWFLINASPIASFTSSCTGLTCSVDASASSDPDGTIVTYSWYFGDGKAGASGATASRTFAAAGTYTITLGVTDNEGALRVQRHDVTVK